MRKRQSRRTALRNGSKKNPSARTYGVAAGEIVGIQRLPPPANGSAASSPELEIMQLDSDQVPALPLSLQDLSLAAPEADLTPRTQPPPLMTAKESDVKVLFSGEELSSDELIAADAPADVEQSQEELQERRSGLLDLKQMMAAHRSAAEKPADGSDSPPDLPSFSAGLPYHAGLSYHPTVLRAKTLPPEPAQRRIRPMWQAFALGCTVGVLGTLAVVASVLALTSVDGAVGGATRAVSPVPKPNLAALASGPSEPATPSAGQADPSAPTVASGFARMPAGEPRGRTGKETAEGTDADRDEEAAEVPSDESSPSDNTVVEDSSADDARPVAAEESSDAELDQLLDEAAVDRERPRAPTPAEPASDESKLPMRLSTRAVQSAMNALAPEVRACHEKYRIPGVVMVRVNVASTGNVTKLGVTGKFADTPTGSCVKRAMRPLTFPAFGGEPFAFDYPYNL